MKLSALILLLAVAPAYAQEEFHLDKEYVISANGTLDLRASDAKVYITGSSRTSAHVKIDRVVTSRGWTFGDDRFKATVEEEGGNIIIRESQVSASVGVIGFYREEYKITIDIPRGVSLKVRGDDGDYFIKNIQGSIDLQLDDADAELVGCTGDNFRFRVDDGDISLDEGRGTLSIDGDDADVHIYKGQFTKIDARIDDGDLVIETSLAEKGIYRLESEDGLVALTVTGGNGEFDVRHDDARVTTEGKFQKKEQTESRTILSLGTGGAQVDIRADDGRVRLAAR